MGRILVLAILLAVMLGLRGVGGSADGFHDPLVLAAIGFVVMASYTAAQLGSALSLPRVSGYIAAGLVLGPSAGNVLTERVVQDMTMFNTLALGLIATGAGLELDLRAMRALLRTLLATLGAKIVLAAAPVFAAFVAIELWLHPVGLSSPAAVIAGGLVLGTLAIGTSPAIALALITETNARGRLADLTLGAAVLKDLVLVVLLAIVLAISAGLLGHATHGGSIPLALVRELGGSVAIGAVLGALIIAYVRFVGAEMLLFVAGLVLAAAELSRALHLDLLLVLIACGCTVRNASHSWGKVQHALETVALPVFVVFFTIAGARIDAQATLSLLPLALLLSALRAAGFFAAGRIGARLGGEGPDVRRLAWQAYLPQAGVSLSLLGLAVEALGPAVGQPLAHIGVACVAVNLAIGPVTLRRALSLSARHAHSGAPPPAAAAAAASVPAPRAQPPGSVPPLVLQTGSRELDRRLAHLYRRLDRSVVELRRDCTNAYGRHISQSLSPLLEAHDAQAVAEQLAAWSTQGHAQQLAEAAQRAANGALEQLMAAVQALAPQVRDPLSDALLRPAAGERARVRLELLWLRLRVRVARTRPQRHVPLRNAARVALGPRLVSLAGKLQASLCRQHAQVCAELRQLCRSAQSLEDTAAAISNLLSEAEQRFEDEAAAALYAGLSQLVQIVVDIDSPRRPLHTLRYSQVEPQLRSRVADITLQAGAWREALVAVEHGLSLAAALSQLRAGLELSLEREVLMPLADAADALEPAAELTRAQLRSTLGRLRAGEATKDAFAQLARALHRAAGEREHRHTSIEGSFRAAAALHAVTSELRARIDALPERASLLAEPQALGALADPAHASLRHLDLRARAQGELAQDFVAVLDLETRRAASAVQEIDAQVIEAQSMALSVVDSTQGGPELSARAADDALELALDNLQEGTARARSQLIAAHDAIAAAFAASFERLQRSTDSAALDPGAARKALTRPLQLLVARAKASAEQLRARGGGLKTWLLGTEVAQQLAGPPDSPQKLRELLSRRTEQELPTSYARLFRLEPEPDLRHAVARDAEVALIAGAERAFGAGGPSSALIVGEPGSGRTTLLNSVQIEITAPRLLRPEAARSRRQEGLLRALAYELRCPANMSSLLPVLRAERTTVLVDDLEHWIAADADGLSELRSLLSLMRQTRKEVFWIVSVGATFVRLATDVLAIEEGFGQVVQLSPLSLPQLRRAIELRHSLSGLNLVVPQVLGKLPRRVLRDTDRDLVFRLLHSISGGNPSAALSVWRNSVRVDGNNVQVLIDRLLTRQLDFTANFDAITTAALVQLHRFGPMSASELSSTLAISGARLQPRLLNLHNAGLVVESAGRQLALALSFRGLLSARLPCQARWRT